MIIDVILFLLSSKIEMQFYSKNKKTSKNTKSTPTCKVL